MSLVAIEQNVRGEDGDIADLEFGLFGSSLLKGEEIFSVRIAWLALDVWLAAVRLGKLET